MLGGTGWVWCRSARERGDVEWRNLDGVAAAIAGHDEAGAKPQRGLSADAKAVRA